MDCKKFLDINEDFSLENHIKQCESCRENNQKNREILKLMTKINTMPSSNFITQLNNRIQERPKENFYDRAIFLLEYCLHRCLYSPIKIAWIVFLFASVLYLPVWCLDYIDSLNNLQNKQQALPIWKTPAVWIKN